VGIGTTTPAHALDVSGTVRLGPSNSGIVITPNWLNNGSWIDLPITGPSAIGSGGVSSGSPWIAYAFGNGYWFTDSSAGDICYRNTSGRLLFGCSALKARLSLSNTSLTIGSSTEPYDTVIHTNVRIQSTNRLTLNNSNNYMAGDAINVYYNVGSGGGHQYTVNNAYIATVNNVGLGIKTTSPSYPLDVSGSARIQGTNLLILNNPNNNLYGDVSNIFYNVGSGGRHQYTVNSATIATINSIGLGIRTTTPSYPLDVVGDIRTSGNIYASGNVGIGTIAPQYKLDVDGTIQTTNIIFQNTGKISAKGTNNALLDILFPCWSDDITYFSYATNGLSITDSTYNNAMFFTPSRLVGIGTTSPAHKLDVSGVINNNNTIQSVRYNFNYSAVPTLTTASSGFRISPTTTPTLPITLASSSAYALTFTSLPIGVYLIQAYAIGTYITTAITNIRLGLNTVNTSPANNFTQQILPVLSTTQVQSIQYNFYLSNTAVTTYYIVFATGASFGASSVTGFTASFIRIA
jgi:hypothetical protein